MPIYEFHCADCNKKFELFTTQRMNTDGAVCRTCHGSNVRKLVSSFASVGNATESYAGAGEAQSTGGGCCGGAGGCACGH